MNEQIPDSRLLTFEEQVAHQERMLVFRQAIKKGFIQNSYRANEIAGRLRLLKGSADRTSVLSQRDVIMADWRRISSTQFMSSWLVRQMAMSTIPQPDLRTYLYATQYLFLAETYVVFLIDFVSYLCERLNTGPPDDWRHYLRIQRRKTVHAKVKKLDELGITCFSKFYDRSRGFRAWPGASSRWAPGRDHCPGRGPMASHTCHPFLCGKYGNRCHLWTISSAHRSLRRSLQRLWWHVLFGRFAN
jgi:hypothetical protein